MIDPVITHIFGWPLRWYGVLVMLGAVVGAWVAEREIRRRRENGEIIWDAMIWVLPAGIIGARLWYVLNSILGGSTYYIDTPAKIINIPEGGLHFFGGLLFGVIALAIFLKNSNKDMWLFLDAIAPATLLGQALARPANFINQELYGQPTTLPWGIPIDAAHRLPEYLDLTKYPVDVTRFHPTFAYEMILNILAFLGLLYISRRYEKDIKPGTIFAGWLVAAGSIRTFIEFFRPDQPRIGDSFVSYSMVVAFLMAVVGVVMLLARFGKIKLAMAEGWEEKYQVTKPEKKTRTRTSAAMTETETSDEVEEDDEEAGEEVEEVVEKPKRKPAAKKPAAAKKPVAKKKTTTKK
jgi:phosphatidylglycerol:prolipoprotein diacylglycerol transferase